MGSLSMHMLVRKMDLLTMKIFLSTIEEKQISKAALRENIAISAVTRRIQELEGLAGTQLLHRSPKGVVPSKAGRALAKHLQAVFGILDDMRQEMNEFVDGVRGQVRLGAPISVFSQGLAGQVADFSREFPMIDVALLEDMALGLINSVKAGHADMCIFNPTHDADISNLTLYPYRKDRLVAIYPTGHAFTKQNSVTMADLLQERLIGIHPETALMFNLQEAAKALGTRLPLKYSVASPGAALCLVESGLGVTVLPECMHSVEDSNRVGAVAIAEDWASRQLVLAIPKDRTLSAPAKLLFNHLFDPSRLPDSKSDTPIPSAEAP